MIYLEILMGCLALSFIAIPITLAVLAKRRPITTDHIPG
jgi:hypothetical protein